MLMQSFKTAKELKVTKEEHAAMIKVLGMLERKELVDVENLDLDVNVPNGFSMHTSGWGCGTAACIGGWVAREMKLDEQAYLNSCNFIQNGRWHLYWGYPLSGATVEEAALALRSFLNTGLPRWGLAAPRAYVQLHGLTR